MSKPIHDSQKVTNKEEYELSLDVIPNNELDQQILSFGSDLEVISPDWYRERIGNNDKEMFEKYFPMQIDRIDE